MIPDFQTPPTVVLGAARSGTKMLRGLIAAADGMHAVPYDVNYIWRYRNDHLPDDVIEPAACSPRIIRLIRHQLSRSAGMSTFSSGQLVEKSVSNILRVPFVACVLPDARYVVLIRDGRDVVESAVRCWLERPNLAYLLNKCRNFPWLACARYGWNFGKSTAIRMLGSRRAKRTPTWGPRYPGIDQHVATLSLLEVCAHQWRACMEAYDRHRDLIPEDRRIEIRYERLVREPVAEIDRLARFLQIPADPLLRHAANVLHASNIGKHSTLTAEHLVAVESIVANSLSRWGYDCNSPVSLDRPKLSGRAA
jgi:hypothetical protein